ncbi:HPr family phosphocarrier protein [Botrimarina hoheduenensis]|uniref:Phosphocarrier protein HPr n=1 Tax=Botrimarina hoheduenensis TaxID=2528000 RepID=A0A5C5W922_9BACT|nr:HPr family phosphocarrier protein [Botrimarina hoheduenensis]TWT46529.1 Phosphocarrier protein HPr [Botrimarina hoheduenensis]
MATRCVEVRHAEGLHARPAELVARTAMRFSSEVTLANGTLCVDAKSILNVLTLGAQQGVEIKIEAVGEDADQAVATLAELIQSDFDAEAGRVAVGNASSNQTTSAPSSDPSEKG